MPCGSCFCVASYRDSVAEQLEFFKPTSATRFHRQTARDRSVGFRREQTWAQCLARLLDHLRHTGDSSGLESLPLVGALLMRFSPGSCFPNPSSRTFM